MNHSNFPSFSRPAVQCFPSQDAINSFADNTILQLGPELHPNIGSLSARESLIRDYRQLIALRETIGDLCGKNMDPEVLKYMGTTYVAKDIAFLATLIDGKDSLMLVRPELTIY